MKHLYQELFIINFQIQNYTGPLLLTKICFREHLEPHKLLMLSEVGSGSRISRADHVVSVCVWRNFVSELLIKLLKVSPSSYYYTYIYSQTYKIYTYLYDLYIFVYTSTVYYIYSYIYQIFVLLCIYIRIYILLYFFAQSVAGSYYRCIIQSFQKYTTYTRASFCSTANS